MTPLTLARRALFACAVAACAAFAPAASAEEIVMRSGATYQATDIELVDEPASVRFTFAMDGRPTTIAVPMDWIQGDCLFGIVHARTKPDDARGQLRLAKIALAKGLRSVAEPRLKKAAALDPTLAAECAAALAAAPVAVEPAKPPAPIVPPKKVEAPPAAPAPSAPPAATVDDVLAREALPRADERTAAAERDAAAEREAAAANQAWATEAARLRRSLDRLSFEIARARLARLRERSSDLACEPDASSEGRGVVPTGRPWSPNSTSSGRPSGRAALPPCGFGFARTLVPATQPPTAPPPARPVAPVPPAVPALDPNGYPYPNGTGRK